MSPEGKKGSEVTASCSTYKFFSPGRWRWKKPLGRVIESQQVSSDCVTEISWCRAGCARVKGSVLGIVHADHSQERCCERNSAKGSSWKVLAMECRNIWPVRIYRSQKHMRIGSFLLLWTWRQDKLREVTGVRRSRVESSSEELVKNIAADFRRLKFSFP